MERLLELFDPYDVKARLFPAIFTLLPFIITAYIWYPNLISLEFIGVNMIVIICILYFLSKLSRELGYKKQGILLLKWGGFPTTIMLRLRDKALDDTTKQRYRSYLTENVKGIVIPDSEEEEVEHSTFYDQQYESAVNWLREHRRDKSKFAIVQTNNASFGFGRNLLGLKPIGIIISLISLLLNLLGVYLRYEMKITLIPLEIWLSFMFSLLITFSWILIINEKMVKSLAYSYAKSILATCEKN
ncbi:hypothetical protein SAMN05216232_3092 [Virgibacillus subterraneus]|uniref:Uncharacterized protein n=1 Tax=Virgibacillus subterraneus TaxID=621109 RepID=A0A1H9I8F8_9BACI|nr:hypothetical protein [Virgibacillus subterraneus]SEQ71011.1 hypothetical protein SAMN05216232_3092 [Virgibacillus subterraneus]